MARAADSSITRLFKPLEGSPDNVLEKTRELAWLHWGTLLLLFLGCVSLAVSFSEIALTPLIFLAAAAGFYYSWRNAETRRRRRDIAIALAAASMLILFYGLSLGRIFTAAHPATVAGAVMACIAAGASFILKRARDYRFIQFVSAAIILLSALSLSPSSLALMSAFFVGLVVVTVQANLEHRRRLEQGGCLSLAQQGRRTNIFVAYVIPILILLIAASLLYLLLPRPMREPLRDEQAGQRTQAEENGPHGAAGNDEGSGGEGRTFIERVRPIFSVENEEKVMMAVDLLFLFYVFVVAVAIAIYYVRQGLGKLRKKREPLLFERARQEASRRDAADFVCLTYMAMCREMSRVGCPRQENDTTFEYLGRIGDHLPVFRKEVSAITDALERTLYAGQALGWEEIQRLNGKLRDVRFKVQARLDRGPERREM